MTEFLQITLNGLLVGIMYALIALGFSLVYRVTNVINLSQGAFCILGALGVYTFTTNFGMNLGLAICLSALLVSLLGVLVASLIFVPGLKRLSNANMLMLTAGLLTLMTGGMLLIWGAQPYALPAFSNSHSIDAFSISLPIQGLWIIGVAAALTFGLWFLLLHTRIGQGLRAIGENPTAATLMGVSVTRMQVFSFSLASLIGGLAGIVMAPMTSLQFDTGNLFTIWGFIAVAIGGMGSLLGAVAGGLFLGVVAQLSTAYLSSLFSNGIALGLLLVVLLWKPSGLLRVGPAKRQDVREEARVWKHITRLHPKVGGLLAVMGLLFVLVAPGLTGPGGVLSGLVIAGILYIALLGLDLLMGYGGQVSLGQAGFMAIGGYTAGYVTTHMHLSPVLGIVLGIFVSLLTSVVLAVITFRLRGIYLALATLAFGLLIESAAVGLESITGGPSGMVGIPALSVGPFVFSSQASMYYVVVAIIVIVSFLLAGLTRSGFGRTLQAIRTDQMAAAALGINVARSKLIAFAISAALASMAGSLYAFFFHFLSPDMVGTTRSLELVSMLIIGGEGTLFGPIFGAVLLTLLPDIFQALAQWKTFASGALLVLCFLYLPEGIYGACIRLIASQVNRFASSEKVGVVTEG